MCLPLRIAVLCGLALHGCAIRQDNLPDGFDTAVMPGTGLIVGSVTSVPDTRFRPPVFEPSAYFYEGIDDPSVRGVLRSGTGNGLGYDTERCAQGIPDEFGSIPAHRSIPNRDCGRLFAVALPAGRYRVHTVQMREPNASAIGMEPYAGKAPQALEWTVVAGEVRYLGEFRSQLCQGSGWAARLEVRDAFARDQALLAERFPSLRDQQIVPLLPPSAPWIWQWPAGPEHPLPEACARYLAPDTSG